MSVSSGSSGPTDKPQTLNEVKTRRLVVFLSGVGLPGSQESLPRVLTINCKSYLSVWLTILTVLIWS